MTFREFGGSRKRSSRAMWAVMVTHVRLYPIRFAMTVRDEQTSRDRERGKSTSNLDRFLMNDCGGLSGNLLVINHRPARGLMFRRVRAIQFWIRTGFGTIASRVFTPKHRNTKKLYPRVTFFQRPREFRRSDRLASSLNCRLQHARAS